MDGAHKCASVYKSDFLKESVFTVLTIEVDIWQCSSTEIFKPHFQLKLKLISMLN